MNAVEFDSWLKKHIAFFPGVGEWLAKTGNRDDVVEAWRKTLFHTVARHAAEASERLYRGENRPGGFGDHAGAVARIARDLRHAASARAKPSAIREYEERCEHEHLEREAVRLNWESFGAAERERRIEEQRVKHRGCPRDKSLYPAVRPILEKLALQQLAAEHRYAAAKASGTPTAKSLSGELMTIGDGYEF